MDVITGALEDVKALLVEKLEKLKEDEKARVVIRKLSKSIYEAEVIAPERPEGVTMYWRNCENEIIIESTKAFLIEDVKALEEEIFKKVRCP